MLEASKIPQSEGYTALSAPVLPQPRRHASCKMGIRSAYWGTIALLGGPLCLGIIFAALHDIIYAHFNGRITESPIEKEWLGRIGTGLAFLVKTLFSATVGTACVQRLWSILRSRPISINSVDSSFSILQSPFVFNLRLLREAPVIVLLAVIT